MAELVIELRSRQVVQHARSYPNSSNHYIVIDSSLFMEAAFNSNFTHTEHPVTPAANANIFLWLCAMLTQLQTKFSSKMSFTVQHPYIFRTEKDGLVANLRFLFCEKIADHLLEVFLDPPKSNAIFQTKFLLLTR
ncbi:hypothetical protein J6590_090584 [Homalodisca vitripennis]|nr:hypothetical protein J6590_093655 [Homalodisca vitripennis]KAG8324514.1 hypothetical protein J6590_090584 [Homalodisca vitripennis]